MKRSSSASGTETILVVNHDYEGLARTQRTLENANYTVETGSACSVAVQRLESVDWPDLILLEVATPDEVMGAIQACRKLRPKQKIVVHAEISDVSTVVQAVRLGALDYLAKPLEEEALVTEVVRLLNSDNPSDRSKQ